MRRLWVAIWSTAAGRVAAPIVLVGLAMALRAALVPVLESRAPYMFFFPVVLACAWWGGLLSGLVAVVATLFASIWFLPPIGDFSITNTGDWVMTGLFVLVATMIALASDAARRLRVNSRDEARRTSDILDQMTVGFVVVDRAWRFVFLNARAVQMANLPYEKLIGQDARGFYLGMCGCQLLFRLRDVGLPQLDLLRAALDSFAQVGQLLMKAMQLPQRRRR